MNHRLSTLFSRKTYSADATEVIDINMADPISQLIIELAVTGVGDVATAHAIACLTKIELVDGSNVLFSLSGYEAEAVDIYHNKRIRPNWNPYLTGLDVQRFIGINFGRKLWDPELAFDPTKFTNPQLKLTLDINAGGNAPVSNKLQVLAALFDEKTISPVGFLMHKEVKDYAMTASAHEYTDLPTDHPYRKLFLRSMYPGAEPDQIIDNIKLSEDQDKRIIFNHNTRELFQQLSADNPLLVESIICPITTGATYGFCTPSSRVYGSITAWAAAVSASSPAFYDGDGGRFAKISSTAAANVQVKVEGFSPHGTFEIPFGDQNDMEDWFDPSALRALRLDITGASGISTTKTLQVFMQQLRRY
jgi:hypothetical protein